MDRRWGSGPAPGERGPRFIAADVLGRPYQRSQRLEVAGEEAARPSLDQHIAESGGLDRAGKDRELARISGELAQERIASAATDQVDDLHGPPGQPRRVTYRSPEGGGQAVEDAPHEPGSRVRDGLVLPDTRSRDPRRHVSRRQEGWIVRVDDRSIWRQLSGGDEEGRQLVRASLELPCPERFLEQPEAHDVAQVADPVVDAALIGEVRLATLIGQDRVLELHADEGPRAAGDVGET